MKYEVTEKVTRPMVIQGARLRMGQRMQVREMHDLTLMPGAVIETDLDVTPWVADGFLAMYVETQVVNQAPVIATDPVVIRPSPYVQVSPAAQVVTSEGTVAWRSTPTRQVTPVPTVVVPAPQPPVEEVASPPIRPPVVPVPPPVMPAVVAPPSPAVDVPVAVPAVEQTRLSRRDRLRKKQREEG